MESFLLRANSLVNHSTSVVLKARQPRVRPRVFYTISRAAPPRPATRSRPIRFFLFVYQQSCVYNRISWPQKGRATKGKNGSSLRCPRWSVKPQGAEINPTHKARGLRSQSRRCVAPQAGTRVIQGYERTQAICNPI